MMRTAAQILLAFAILQPGAAIAQRVTHTDVGLPYFFEHFTPEEYHGYIQNWAITQDARGFVYVANNQGILEYDGVSWRLIPTPSGTIVRALATDRRGIVYVGTQGDLGYLHPDRSGTLRFVSLIDEIDPIARDFKDVWTVHATKDGVYFQARQWLFRWDGRDMKAWKAEGVFHNAFRVKGTLYVREQGRGLLEMDGDSLRVAPGGERFAAGPIYVMLPLDEKVLVGTYNEGLMLYDGASFRPFTTQADALFDKYWLYAGAVLPNGDFALATIGGGVAVIDRNGNLKRVLNEASGLSDTEVNAVYADNQGGLWLALNSQGIARVNPSPQLSVFDRRLGLEGFVEDVLRHKGVLYTATSSGLFFLQEAERSSGGSRPATFVRIPEVTGQVRALLSLEDELLVASLHGIFLIRDGEVVPTDAGSKTITKDDAFHLVASDAYPGRVYAGTRNGLIILTRSGDTWERLALPNIKAEIRSLAEGAGGVLWLGSIDGDIYRLTFGRRGFEPQIQRFGAADGLPGDFIKLTPIGSIVRFASRHGMYKYVGSSGAPPGTPAFVLDTRFSVSSSADRDTLLLSASDSLGNVWLGYTDRIVIAKKENGSYRRVSPDVLRFQKSGFRSLNVEPTGVAWMNDGDGLLRYDSRVDVSYDDPYAAWVRRITLVGSDSVVFGGAALGADGSMAMSRDATPPLVLKYEDNNIAIEFAAPSYNGAGKNVYQYYLEGRDGGWSPWSARTTAVYTNLPEGAYRFHVRALNAQGYVSSIGSFSFERLPPWYRTWWAYGIYVLLLGGFSILLLHYRKVIQENRLARKQADQLARERVANERLQEANLTLQEANERLQQADLLKDEFLTNTSHELRTPITAILGFTSVLKEEVPPEFHEFLDIIDENSKRLLHTVSSLLDLAKLKAGVLEMNEEIIDLATVAAEVMRLLSPLAQHKGIYVEVDGPDQPVCALLDRQSYERVLYNLIGNAIKFTDEGGVTIRVEVRDGEAYVYVEDTGAGMDAAFMPYLFEEFRQESTGLARSHEGSGLGLAITARLVELMHGRIEVESKKDVGSRFTVIFPAEIVEEEPVADMLDGAEG